MTVQVRDVEGARTLTIDFNNEQCPESGFLVLDNGACYEFDRSAIITALKLELGLFPSLEESFRRWCIAAEVDGEHPIAA